MKKLPKTGHGTGMRWGTGCGIRISTGYGCGLGTGIYFATGNGTGYGIFISIYATLVRLLYTTIE